MSEMAIHQSPLCQDWPNVGGGGCGTQGDARHGLGQPGVWGPSHFLGLWSSLASENSMHGFRNINFY